MRRLARHGPRTLLCLWLAGMGVAHGDILLPRPPLTPHPPGPTATEDDLSHTGTLWVEGALLSSPCVSGRQVMQVTHPGGVPRPVLVLDGCGDGARGDATGLPVTLTVRADGMVTRPRQARRLTHGQSALTLPVTPTARVLRVEMNYE